MAEPALSLAEWFSAAVAAILAGLTGAMGWFNRTKKHMHARLATVEGKMEGHILDSTTKHGDHQTKIAVLETCQENTARQLEQLNETTNDVNKKLDALISKFVDARG